MRQIRIESTDGLDAVVLSMEGVNFIDTEGADVLNAIAQAGIDNDIDLHPAPVKPQVASSTSSAATAPTTTSPGAMSSRPPSARLSARRSEKRIGSGIGSHCHRLSMAD